MKRKLNGKAIALIAFIIMLGISVYKIPHFINVTKLEKLGYSDEAIEAIYNKKLKNKILQDSLYSDYLNEEITKDSFKEDYYRLYAVSDNLNERSFLIYDRLKELKDYCDDELLIFFGNLEEYEITPLLVFDKVNVDTYINDCAANHNSKDTFILTNNYFNELVNEVNDPDNIEVFISKKFSIGNYEPVKLVEVSSRAVEDKIYLESRALAAYNELFDYMQDNNMAIYAYDGYVAYDKQAYPGMHDSQSGFGVYLVSADNKSVSYFNESTAYNYLLAHGHEFGFILRYPLNKDSLTGFPGEANYFRYVGKDLATEIYESGLTFDEYYMLYMY